MILGLASRSIGCGRSGRHPFGCRTLLEPPSYERVRPPLGWEDGRSSVPAGSGRLGALESEPASSCDSGSLY
eukprot:4227269-Prymnesium_polylepis.2